MSGKFTETNSLVGTPLLKTPGTVFTPGTVREAEMAAEKPLSQEERSNNLKRESQVISELRDIEVLPMLLDLIEELRLGKLAPKDFDNAAGRIRVRINRCKSLVNQIEGLSDSPEVGIENVEKLQKRMEEKRAVLMNFKEKVKDELGKSEVKAEDNDNDAMDVDEE